MNKGFWFVVLMFLISGFLKAQPKGFHTVSDESAFKTKFAQTAKSTHSIKSSFTQEKNLSVLSEKIVSKGNFLFKNPGMVKMEYLTPFKYLLVINKDKVTIKDSQKTNSFSSKSNKLFEHINRIVVDCVQGTAMENKDFKPAVFENEKQYLLVLSPQKKDLKEFFSNINIYIDKKEGVVQKIDMKEPSGDNTIINFENKQINAEIPDSEFIVR